MSAASDKNKDEKKDDHPHAYPSSADAYDVLEEIGQGAFASVYRAVVKSTGEEVAVKVMNLDEFNLNWEDVSREIHTMCQLHHPNVVRFLCSFADGADLWVVMPLLEAGSCAAIMKVLSASGFKDEVLIATILKESLKGLEYLHKHNYIHRDIKSANILVSASGGIQLADFGVAGTLIENGDRQKNRKTFTGTPCWMAPEVMENTQGYDARADIWSLGITALELGFGRAPYSKLHPLKVMVATLQEDPPTADVYNDNSYKFSSNYHEFVRKCLKKERDKRPTATKLLEHKFLRIAKDSHYIYEKLVAKLPPRPKINPINRPHVGAQKAEEDRQKEQKSKPVSVGSWIFDADSFAKFKEKYGEEVKAEVMTQRAVAATYSHHDTDSDDDKDALSPTGKKVDGNAGSATTPQHHHESFVSGSAGVAPVEEQAGRFIVCDEVVEDGGGAPVFHSVEDNAAGQHVGRFSVTDEDADA